MVDVLHTADLGFTAHVVGNVLNECILAKAWSNGTTADNVVGANAALKVWYMENKVTSVLKGDIPWIVFAAGRTAGRSSRGQALPLATWPHSRCTLQLRTWGIEEVAHCARCFASSIK